MKMLTRNHHCKFSCAWGETSESVKSNVCSD